MGKENMSANKNAQKPILLVFAGPNGSGKTTLRRGLDRHGGIHVDADDFKVEYDLTDLDAAKQAEALRNTLLTLNEDFSFETVLFTERNLTLLERAKSQGYEVQCFYVLTCDENINVARVKARHVAGGLDVPEEKIRSRYHRGLMLLPRLISLCDKILIYDNSDAPALIFQKENEKTKVYKNKHWPESVLERLLKSVET